MRKFIRGLPPVNMETTKKKYHNQWSDDFCKSDEHAAIGETLYERQSHYCAYCEILLQTKNDGFIEHLERRSDNPQRIFDWSNMFFSCNSSDSCGNYKDNAKTKQSFKLADIVDPAKENPSDFFGYDMNGRIYAKDDEHKLKANETIRVFNLNNACLTSIRAGITRILVYFLQSDPDDAAINEFLNYMSSQNCPSVCESLLKERLA